MLVITDERFLDHDTGHRHPERPDRLRAALAGVAAVDHELLAGGGFAQAGRAGRA